MVTMEADEDVWRYLQVRKQPGDSFNDVLRRELELDDATGAEQPERAATRRESGAVSHARDALADWDPADADSQKARRAVCEVVGWLATQDGPQQKADVLAWAQGERIEGYAASTLWDKVAQPGLRALVEAGVVEHQRNVGYEIVDEEE